ncbi:MAG: ROK family protein [Tissierellia bacterium]|nr:ROK family protein [Tissierellia bacterium]
MYLIFDIGGSSTKIAIINDKLEIINKYNIMKKDSLQEFVCMLEEQSQRAIDEHSIRGIGISSPGSVDPKSGSVQGISAVEYIADINFAYQLQEKFKLPVAIENDANCSALAEIYMNKPKEKNICFFVIGSGIGGAVLMDEELIHGRRFESGEFGYMLFNTDDGIKNLSSLATLPNIVKKMKEKYKIDTNTYELLDKYLEKIEPYYSEVDLMFNYLCMGLYNVQYCLDPQVIYIGGGVSQSGKFIDSLERKLQEESFKSANIKIRQATRYNDNNLYGACANLIKMIEKGEKLCIQSE